jgi:hypothetical protein
MPWLRRASLVVAVLVVTGCASTRVVPVAAPGVTIAPEGAVVAAAEGVELVVNPSAWHGSPSYLPGYVTPFHCLLVDGTALPLSYDYADFRLFDEARFQYTALPPADVGRLLRWSGEPPPVQVASVSASYWRRRSLFWDPWWWDPWWGHPGYYYAPSRLDDVLSQALPVGTLQAAARIQGFVYFPRLRPEATRLTFEFHYRLGDAARVLTIPFAVERAEGGPARVVAVPAAPRR